MQAPNITHKGKRKRRIMPAPTGGTAVPRGGGVSAGVRQNSQSSFASVLRFLGKVTASRDADMGAMRRHKEMVNMRCAIGVDHFVFHVKPMG
jgi:hypothetical protein